MPVRSHCPSIIIPPTSGSTHASLNDLPVCGSSSNNPSPSLSILFGPSSSIKPSPSLSIPSSFPLASSPPSSSMRSVNPSFKRPRSSKQESSVPSSTSIPPKCAPSKSRSQSLSSLILSTGSSSFSSVKPSLKRPSPSKQDSSVPSTTLGPPKCFPSESRVQSLSSFTAKAGKKAALF